MNKLAIMTNFLAFFLFLFDNFSLLDPDPDPGVKMNADPCGSGSTALLTVYLNSELGVKISIIKVPVLLMW